MIITFTNVIGAIRSLGEAAQVITTNLKMWLGFETSETLGTEKVVDGDFSSSVNWADSGNQWVINNNTATYTGDGTANDLLQEISFIGGRTYEIKIDVASIGGTLKVRFDNDQANKAEFSQTGIQTLYITATGSGNITDDLSISREPGVFNAVLNSVSVKELTQITPDKSGNNNVGELFTGKALEFNGSTEYVDVDGFQMSGNTATFSFWINPTTIGSNNKHIIDINPNRFIIGFNNSQLSLYSAPSWHNFGSISTDVYQKVSIVINNTNVKCYVNGIQLGVDKTITAIDLSSATKFKICSHYLAASNFVDCELSNLQIYNSVWSTDDIAYDYANPNKLAIDNPSTNLVVTNLKGYWALSEGDGKLAYDSGTNLEEEEVVDGDFPLPNVNWTLGDGWSVNNNTVVYDGTGSQYAKIIQTLSTVVGRTYQMTFTLSGFGSGDTVNFGLGRNGAFNGYTQQTYSSNGTYTRIMQAQSIDDDIMVQVNQADANCTVSNISVREVTPSDHGGLINGADYVDAQPRIPQLGMQNWSKGSNLLPYSEDFTEWIINSGTSQVVLAASEAAPYGQGDVYSVIMQASENDAYIRYATDNTTLTSSTHSVWVKQAPTGSATHIRITNNNKGAWDSGTSQKIALTSSWQRLETTDSITGNRFTIIGSADASGNQDSDCLGKALIYGAQLLEGSSAGVYRFTDGGATSNSTVIANPTIPTKDIFGNAVRDRLNSFNLDGSGYAEVADDTDLDFGTGDFSVEAWVKFEFENQGSGFNVIYCNGNEFNDSNTFSLSSNSSSKISFLVNNTSCNSTSTFSLNEWVHVVGTRIQGTDGVKLYINGNTTPEDTATNNNTVTNSFDKTVGYDTHSSRYYNNIISDVRVYSQALTSDEVENNYNAGLSAHTN